MKPLILASTSPFRRALLDDLGISYEAVAPPFDEVNTQLLKPEDMAADFARGKAASLADRYPQALILGSDQVPALGDQILRKPESPADAVEQLMALSGRTHRLITSVALLDASTGTFYEETTIHLMKMRALQRKHAEAYVRVDRPMGCAGGYKVEGAGSALFEAMEGIDHTGIIGLPISSVGRLMEQTGEDWLGRALGLSGD